MTFNTRLNVGDTVWYISTPEGCIMDTTITGVTIVHKPFRPDIQTSVVYENNDNCNFAEENEGKYWWTTRKAIIDHLTKVLMPLHKENLNEEFEEFFREPPSKATQNLQNAFDEVYGKKKPVEDDFKIAIPPDLYRRISKISDQIFKKTSLVKPIPEGIFEKSDCNCGHHRKSELAARFMKLPGIREKTLSDYADEL